MLRMLISSLMMPSSASAIISHLPATGLRLAHLLMAMNLLGLALSVLFLAPGPPPAPALPAPSAGAGPPAGAGVPAGPAGLAGSGAGAASAGMPEGAGSAQFQDTLAVNDILVPVLVRTRSR